MMSEILKITLGTAQLGMPYGISGRPLADSPKELLDAARSLGVNTLDTAAGYGESESRIGEYLRANPEWQPKIVTKIIVKAIEPGELRRELVEKVDESLSKLNRQRIYGLLLHRFSDLKQNGAAIIEVLKELVQSGKVERIGVSVYSPDELDLALRHDVFKIFQGPLNVFDQRLLRSGLLEIVQATAKEFYARSVYLQGLFFLDENGLRKSLPQAVFYVKRLEALAGESGYSVADLAFLFVRDCLGVHSLVMGVKGVKQLKKNIDLLDKDGLPDRVRQKITEAFSLVPLEICDPRCWRKEGATV
jgi:aryl-alcohol dehydrogenase-like predicted oxidoreductase